MKTKKGYSKENYIPAQLICPHCFVKIKVFEKKCPRCQREVHQKINKPALTFSADRVRLPVLMGILICLSSLVGIRKIFLHVEYHMNNINNQNRIYNQSLVDLRETSVKHHTQTIQ